MEAWALECVPPEDLDEWWLMPRHLVSGTLIGFDPRRLP
jgi:hypothetical protein